MLFWLLHVLIVRYYSPQFVSNFERGLCAPPLNKMKTLVQLYAMNSEEVQIFNADNIISAVYVGNENGTLALEYKPDSFKYGAWISSASFLMLIIFFSIKLFYRKNKPEASLQGIGSR